MNPILNAIGTTNLTKIKQAYQTAKAMSNPEQMLMQMMGNPQMADAMRLIRENNGDAKSTFYKLAQQKGVNPEDVLNELSR